MKKHLILHVVCDTPSRVSAIKAARARRTPKSVVCSLWSVVFPTGAILGLHKHEIAAQFDEIIDFAEIGAFSWKAIQTDVI